MTIFGVAWDELELEHVERFLASAGREALSWEAKGTEVRAEQVTKHVGGFANAPDSGYLLLGFELVDDEWRATGFDFPGGDPPVWISNVVRTTLGPRPRVDVRDWEVSGGKRAAVVRVDPVAEPPCVTTGGQLYERASGETIPVRDPADVRALYERGRAAAERAEANALRAVEAVLVGAVYRPEGPWLILALAVAPVGTARDIAAQVFAPAAEERLLEAAAGLPHDPLFPEYGHPQDRVPVVRVAQDAISFETTPLQVHSWRLRMAWDGSVAGLLRVSPRKEVGAAVITSEDEGILANALFDDGIRPLALVVEEAARRVGGFGRAKVVLRPIAWQFNLSHGPLRQEIPDEEALRPIQRWAEGEPWLDEQLLESMKPELLRACGIPEWEPGP